MNEEGTAPQRADPAADLGSSGPALAAEVSRRVGAILDSVEREASRLRQEARADAARYLEDARRRADELVAERQRRIAEVSDDLLAKSEAVVSRLDDAAPVREGFEHLVRALGDAAERLAAEGGAMAAAADSASNPPAPAFAHAPAASGFRQQPDPTRTPSATEPAARDASGYGRPRT